MMPGKYLWSEMPPNHAKMLMVIAMPMVPSPYQPLAKLCEGVTFGTPKRQLGGEPFGILQVHSCPNPRHC